MPDDKLRELAEKCVLDMGDVFYEPDEWGDYRWGLDDDEEPRENETAYERLINSVTECVYQALLQAYEMGRSAARRGT